MNDKKKHAGKTVLNGLKHLEYRGYDSWGIAVANLKTIDVDKHVGKIGSANSILTSGLMAIGHTRWATHGRVTNENAHPHLDCIKSIAVVHNGIVENYQELKTILVKQGHRFQSETDTEIIAHLIEEKRKKYNFPQAVFVAFKLLIGSNAIVVLDSHTQSIIACRNGSPLVFGKGNKELFLSSDITAFSSSVKQIYYLNDNEAVMFNERNNYAVFSLYSGRKIHVSVLPFNWKKEHVQKGIFAHFLIKEITEQKSIIPKTLFSQKTQIKYIRSYISRGYLPIFVGCGTASYCGHAATYVFSRAGIISYAIGAYEVKPFLKNFSPRTLIIAISQSGETADTLEAVKLAKKQKLPTIAIVNARHSSLERLTDYVLPVNAGTEIAVVSTKAFTAQLAVLFSLVMKKSQHLFIQKKLDDWFVPLLHHITIKLAKKLVEKEHAFVIGKHINYAGALEFALKLKETSYLHAEAFSAGELKHGVIALIQQGTPCFILTDSGQSFKEVCSSAAELKVRGGYIIGIGPKNSEEFDEWIQTPDVDEQYSIFFNVIVGQLLGYYLGIGRGADPDKPRNLAKSVTVK